MTDRLDVWSMRVMPQSDHYPSFAAVGPTCDEPQKSPQVARTAVNLEHVNLQAQGSKWLRMGLICYLFTVTCTTNTQAFGIRLHTHFFIVDTLAL